MKDEIMSLLKATDRRLDTAESKILEQQATIRSLKESLRDDQAEIRRLEMERDSTIAFLHKMNPIHDKPGELVRGHGETILLGEAVTANHLGIVRWRDTRHELPEESKSVLMSLQSGEEWTGFLADDGAWKFISGDAVGETVTHWLEYPAAPIAKEAQP